MKKALPYIIISILSLILLIICVNWYIDKKIAEKTTLTEIIKTDSNARNDVDRNEPFNYTSDYPCVDIEHCLRSSPTYRVELFGGIIDGKIEVKNLTDREIRDIQFKVTYIRTNGDIYSENDVSLKLLEAHETSTITFPNATLGSKVKVAVTFARFLKGNYPTKEMFY